MRLPVKGVSSGSGWLANRGVSVKDGRKRVSFGLCVFSCSFGVRSIVLCKCSGNVLIGYNIYIYIILFFFHYDRETITCTFYSVSPILHFNFMFQQF